MLTVNNSKEVNYFLDHNAPVINLSDYIKKKVTCSLDNMIKIFNIGNQMLVKVIHNYISKDAVKGNTTTKNIIDYILLQSPPSFDSFMQTLNLPIREIRPRSHTIGNDSDVKHLQKQVAITVDIMHKNIQLGLNRAENLDDLERRSSGIMEEKTKRMARITRAVREKHCWENTKTWIIVISVVMIIIGIIMILMIFGIINKFID
ncbi:unnamed protein product [Rotaria magnacalcarata]